MRWSLDIEEYGERIVLKWIKGTDNIPGDAISRNPADRDVAKHRKMPEARWNGLCV